MYYDIIKLFNLEQFNIKIKTAEITKIDNVLYCYMTLGRNTFSCPYCGGTEISIKDYRKKKIKHSISTNNPCYIIYNARRYKCNYCNSTFYEANPFSSYKQKTSTCTIYTTLRQLLNHTNTFTGVAQNLNLSVTTVFKIFDTYVECRRAILPKIICFDEFYRSRKTTDKYAFVMADFQTNKIIDVYHSRRKDKLDSYFSRIPQKERDNVEYIIIDMWDTYRDLAEILFKNAKIAVDSFHVIKHLNEAMINIRLRIMRKYEKNTKSLYSNDMYYYMLKKFHYFFVKEFDDIYDGLIEIRNSHLEQFRTFGKLLKRWKPNIKNSFIRIDNKRLSNGPMEGINSRIKTILKSANGIKQFYRLRNRIIYSINKDVPIKKLTKK